MAEPGKKRLVDSIDRRALTAGKMKHRAQPANRLKVTGGNAAAQLVPFGEEVGERRLLEVLAGADDRCDSAEDRCPGRLGDSGAGGYERLDPLGVGGQAYLIVVAEAEVPSEAA